MDLRQLHRLDLNLVGNPKGRLSLNTMLSQKPAKSFAVDFTTNAHVDLALNLELDVGEGEDAGLPKLKSDLVIDWGWMTKICNRNRI